MMAPSAFEPAASFTLRDLATALGAIRVTGDPSVAVRGVRQDSRSVETGELFAVRSGAKTTGWKYVTDAIARGAVAVMAEEDLSPVPLRVPVLVVRDVRSAIAQASAIVYGEPTRSLAVIGITGTNGKTTTSYLVVRALEACGERPGLIGTIGYRFEDWTEKASHTTPESDDIARLAAAMLERGASHLVMEVSSHALSQSRVEAVHFQAAAFTNLTQDHLEFHGSMEAYGEAKARLFLELAPAVSIVNVDDPFGRDLARRLAAMNRKVVTVSNAPGGNASVAPESVEFDFRSTRATVRTPGGPVTLESKLIGAHNLSNMLLGLGISSALGLDVERAAASFADARVPGRLERCDEPGDDLVAVVDYAHTPDALDRMLSALTTLRHGSSVAGRIICVFGCGGDRDPQKRAPMGRAVGKWADVAVVTSDNPRSEDPQAIVQAILPGLDRAKAVVVELDRGRAIADAIAGARAGDIVVIAGKGHETEQIEADAVRHFDDREEARSALARRRMGKGAKH
jgi:UDP-N-acetylmuramoyl-L-alanyl-D-glutamate--2,6-diaminopimelate ligase